jgi:hypothetical protein
MEKYSYVTKGYSYRIMFNNHPVMYSDSRIKITDIAQIMVSSIGRSIDALQEKENSIV